VVFSKKKLFSEQWCSEYNSGSSSGSISGSTSSSSVVSGSIIKHVWASFLSFLLELKELVPLAFLYTPFSGWSRLKFPLLTLLVFFLPCSVELGMTKGSRVEKAGEDCREENAAEKRWFCVRFREGSCVKEDKSMRRGKHSGGWSCGGGQTMEA